MPLVCLIVAYPSSVTWSKWQADSLSALMGTETAVFDKEELLTSSNCFNALLVACLLFLSDS